MKGIPFHPPDLPLVEGAVYHLRLKPGELAEDILLVGDPGRVDFIGRNLLRELELRRENRGLVTITGYTEWGQRVSVTTSGMGTPSLEIVLNEIIALHEIDFETMRRRDCPPRLNIIRVGTSGGLQRDVELGTPVVTAYAVGLDNTGLFYEAPCPDDICSLLETRVREALEEVIPAGSRFKGRVGITVSNSGFFANQGRSLCRIPPTVPDIDVHLALIPAVTGLRFENMEMETSFLLHLLYPLDHQGGAICPVIDRRPTEEFLRDYRELSARTALGALRRLREWT